MTSGEHIADLLADFAALDADEGDPALLSATEAFERAETFAEPWSITRRRALLRAGHQCQRCEGTERLDVLRLADQRQACEADLVVLCARCHEAERAGPET